MNGCLSSVPRTVTEGRRRLLVLGTGLDQGIGVSLGREGCSVGIGLPASRLSPATRVSTCMPSQVSVHVRLSDASAGYGS